MTDYIIKNFGKILVDRKGNIPDSYMKTTDILGHVETGNTYILKDNGLELTKATKTIEIIETNQSSNNQPLNTMILKNRWNSENKFKVDNSNILGLNVEFVVDTDTMSIPIEETNQTNLSYFGAHLLKHGDIITINSPYPIPITKIEIGKNYIDGYLLTDMGGGCYLEYHDTPHLHMPVNSNSSGYLILGKETDSIIHLAAFQIPYGYAIYTKPFTIHCDAFLVGQYIVLYTVTPNYSTALLRHNGNIVHVCCNKFISVPNKTNIKVV